MPNKSENRHVDQARHHRFFLYFDMLLSLLEDNRKKAKAGKWAIIRPKDDGSTYLINLRLHPTKDTVGFYDPDPDPDPEEWTNQYGWAWRTLDDADFVYVLPEKDIANHKIAALYQYVEAAQSGLDMDD
tara:strand:+ start:159 stop:545 length:387 start_codon:yes stop_codon:yes gene_type:complete